MANERSREIDWSFATAQPHLPPKSPLFPGGTQALPDSSNSLFSNWPNFPSGNRRHHQNTQFASFLPQTPPWIDDLLNDSPDVPPKKGSHRRSSSDSVAFLEASSQQTRADNIAEGEQFGCEFIPTRPSRGSIEFDKFDEEQLSSMLSEIGSSQKQEIPDSDVNLHQSPYEKRTPTMETPSTPSDHDSVNEHSLEDERTGGVGQFPSEHEVQSGQKAEHTSSFTGKDEFPNSSDTTLDPKRAKRILANRQSAQRSRVRKLQYIAELERSVNALQAEVSTLSPQVAYLDRHRIVLNVDNSAIKQRIAALAQEKLFRDAQNETLKKEVHRLRQLYQQQQHQQLEQNLSFDIRQQQFTMQDLPGSLQTQLKEDDISSEVMKCVDAVFKDNEVGFNKTHTSSLTKTIGPSSCSTGEKGKGLQGQIMSGIAPIPRF